MGIIFLSEKVEFSRILPWKDYVNQIAYFSGCERIFTPVEKPVESVEKPLLSTAILPFCKIPCPLYEFLYKTEMLNVKLSRLGNYTMRKGDEDTRNATYQAMTGKFMNLAVSLDAVCSFETPENMAILCAILNA